MAASVSLGAPMSGDGIIIAGCLAKNEEFGDQVLVWHERESCAGAHSYFEGDLGKIA